MRKAVLFIATSLDGYIADENGGVGWLEDAEDGLENSTAYWDFIEGIDTILMGWNTYHQIITELSPERWIYGDFTTYVFTHRQKSPMDQIHFTEEGPADLLQKLKGQEGKDIWICGGASLVGQLMHADLIDRHVITILPILLGKGIRLFEEFPQVQPLSLIGMKQDGGTVELTYERRAD